MLRERVLRVSERTPTEAPKLFGQPFLWRTLNKQHHSLTLLEQQTGVRYLLFRLQLRKDK